MKKKITTVFLTLATAIATCQDMPAHFESARLPIEAKISQKHSFGYLKMEVSDSQLPTNGVKETLPGAGAGYRFVSGASAIDLSASYSHREIKTDVSKEQTYTYTLPKVNYLYYISPTKNNSLYAGAGLAVGGCKTKDGREFHGLVPNAAIGFEMNRNASWHSFAQIDVSQPALAAIQTGSLPDPSAEFSFGVGF